MTPTRQIAQPTHGGFCNDYPTCYAATPLFAQSHHSSSRHFREKKAAISFPADRNSDSVCGSEKNTCDQTGITHLKPLPRHQNSSHPWLLLHCVNFLPDTSQSRLPRSAALGSAALEPEFEPVCTRSVVTETILAITLVSSGRR